MATIVKAGWAELRENEIKLVGQLNVHKVIPMSMLANNLGVSTSRVRNTIKTLRRKFNLGHPQVKQYVHMTPKGYSLIETQEGLIYEAQFRLKLGYGVLYSGLHVFNRCNQLKLKPYENLKLSFNPKAIAVQQQLGTKMLPNLTKTE